MWTSFGMVLGVLLRQSAMAIGAGLVYSIAIEGLIFALLGRVSFMATVEKAFPRANAGALIEAFGSRLATRPVQPLVGALQAVLVLAAYAVAFVAIAGAIARGRDVTN